MCDEEQDFQYRAIVYTCACSIDYELSVQVDPFMSTGHGEHDFVCQCGGTYTHKHHAGLPGRVVSFRIVGHT